LGERPEPASAERPPAALLGWCSEVGVENVTLGLLGRVVGPKSGAPVFILASSGTQYAVRLRFVKQLEESG
jgi:hypothetical protein